MAKLIQVVNELPVLLRISGNQSIGLVSRDDGYSTGLKAFYKKENCHWLGQTGSDKSETDKIQREAQTSALLKKKCFPVYLEKKEKERFLDGFSIRTIWPLFHYFPQNTVYREEYWKAYIAVNKKYSDALSNQIEEGDRLWIQNYQLMLLPKMIREMHPEISIGFFLHIPFPSFEIFRLLPWRQEILEGLLGADLVGFQTYDYERHFMSCVRRLLGFDTVFNRIHLKERIVKVDFFPIGIDYKKISEVASRLNKTRGKGDVLESLLGQHLMGKDKKLILSIDRLDYTKGIPVRLKAFESFLKSFPQYHEKVCLLFIVHPSRESAELYKSLKKELDELVGRINSSFGSVNWVPVWYFYRQIEFDEMAEMYLAADIALITPIRDGMNLIAKQYLAARIHNTGVLIISEMAGASKELSEAIIVNPNNRKEIAESIRIALEMPKEEQIRRNKLLRKRLKNYNVEKWAGDFVRSLDEVKKIQEIKLARKVTAGLSAKICHSYKNAKNRILFLDYDGTLMGFNKDPQQVVPDADLYETLKKLSNQPVNRLVIISGRDKETLSKWFPPDWNISLVAEHGVWTREPGADWSMIEQIDKKWMDIIHPILEFYVDRTPRSFVEEKNYSLVWHYRDADPDLGIQRSWGLKEELKELVLNLNLEIMDGDKVIEIKNSGINKGRAAKLKMGEVCYDFILAIGDDWTDEYTFDAIPEIAFTIKVGTKTTKADYYVDGVPDVRNFLRMLSKEECG